jgi:exodeoxyribonuclease VII small subunit
MTNSKPKTFESSLEELERIVRELEQGELTLEKSLELFERGVKLSRECQERLSQAERRIEMLTRDNQGRAIVTAFEPESELSASTSDDDDSSSPHEPVRSSTSRHSR